MKVKKALGKLAKHLGRQAVGNIFHDGHMDGVNDVDSTYGFNPPPRKKKIRNLPYRD